MTTPACPHPKADGSPCAAIPTASGACWFHSPEGAEGRAAARAAGGRNHRARTAAPDTPAPPLDTVADVKRFLGRIIHEVHVGEIDVKIANSIGLIASTLLRAIEGSDIEERLKALEDAAAVRGGKVS